MIRANPSEEDKIKQKATNIYEGYPITKTLHNELDMFIAHFEVDIPENEDISIIIDVQNIQSKTRTFIKFGQTPSSTDYDFKLGDGVLTIKPDDVGYNRQGTYFVITFPDFNFLDLFVDNYYTFTFQWRLENMVPHLNSQTLLQVTTKPYAYSYLKHYIQDLSDLRVSLLAHGHQDIFISAHPSLPHPTNDTYDFTTKFLKGGNYQTGKSILLPMPLLQKSNPSCVDLGYTEKTDPCVIYIGIYCQEASECQSQVEIDYESSTTPKRLYSGQIKHAVMLKESQNYYYMSVNKETAADLFAILEPHVGDADLFVNIYKQSKAKSEASPDLEWNLPSLSQNTVSSHTKLNQEMLTLSKDFLLKECGFTVPLSTAQNVDLTEDEDCIIVFGIIPSSDTDNTKELLYNFVVYKNVMEVKSMQPAYGFVQEGQFSYFLYKETCKVCNLIISLSSY